MKYKKYKIFKLEIILSLSATVYCKQIDPKIENSNDNQIEQDCAESEVMADEILNINQMKEDFENKDFSGNYLGYRSDSYYYVTIQSFLDYIIKRTFEFIEVIGLVDNFEKDEKDPYSVLLSSFEHKVFFYVKDKSLDIEKFKSIPKNKYEFENIKYNGNDESNYKADLYPFYINYFVLKVHNNIALYERLCEHLEVLTRVLQIKYPDKEIKNPMEGAFNLDGGDLQWKYIVDKVWAIPEKKIKEVFLLK